MRRELVTIGRGLTVLRDGRGMPEWQPSVLQADGSRTLAWPKYPQPVMVALMAALEVTGSDFEYLEHIEAVRRTPIASASSSDLATWFTYLFRGERFSDGHIEGFIRSGQLQAMLERLLELSAAAGSAGSSGSSGS
ncbi:DUF6508 domain-containing protein [Microbacterium sp.]|uniref:DUF6508 domain-containing protein n=1 Tax=Microbacterium sp. TaxID=51671 RepID=UPI002620772F|nr:DUF6508 domain-containing protein [uncultured Microbacterium sp.]